MGSLVGKKSCSLLYFSTSIDKSGPLESFFTQTAILVQLQQLMTILTGILIVEPSLKIAL